MDQKWQLIHVSVDNFVIVIASVFNHLGALSKNINCSTFSKSIIYLPLISFAYVEVTKPKTHFISNYKLSRDKINFIYIL